VSGYVLGPDADLDLDAIWEYIAADNIAAADRRIAKLFDAFEALGQTPGMGHRREDLSPFAVPVLACWSLPCHLPRRAASTWRRFWRLGMSIAANVEARIQSVSVTDDTISAQLADGRTISAPLAWSWRLSEATPEQRARFEIIGSGSGIRWPEIDEDISVEGMLHGVPASRPASNRPSSS